MPIPWRGSFAEPEEAIAFPRQVSKYICNIWWGISLKFMILFSRSFHRGMFIGVNCLQFSFIP